MAKIARRRLAGAVVRVLQQNPQHQKQLMQQVAAYLINNGQAHQAHLLMADVANELLAANGHVVADVVTARPLGEPSRQSIITMLQQATGAKSVELNEQRDESLIGGVVVRTATHELDASIKRQLTQLAGGTK